MLVQKNVGAKSIWSCDTCGSNFLIPNHRIPQTKNHFCSKVCYGKHMTLHGYKRVVDWAKNNTNPNFRGGIGITTDGYVWLLIRGHGYPYNQIKLHRYLMQIKLGRNLLPSEIVHHINGDKLDNRIENLELTTRSEHNKAHRHFSAENRDDIWSEKELALVATNTPAKEIQKLYPHRTTAAIFTQRHKLKRRKRGMRSLQRKH